MEQIISDITWVSLIPPIVAIGLALITRQVVFSLFLGVFSGTLILCGYNPLTAFLSLIDRFILPSLANKDHAAIIIFSMMLGGMVGVISKSGGIMSIVTIVEKLAKTARSAQLSTLCMGVAIFFDDYANTLIVGNTMRPITDDLKVSREKLSYIVDSTAAPVAGLFLSTWIGYEIGIIGDAMKGTGYTIDPFSVFLMSIPYRFYLLLAIAFVAIVALSKRDFGPMLKAERRARAGKGVIAKGSEPASDLTDIARMLPTKGKISHWSTGVVPILVTIAVTIIGLWYTGKVSAIAVGADITIKNIISNASSSTALFWGSLSGCTIGILLAVGQRILTLHEAMEAWFAGIKSMLLAMIILILAWSISSVTKELGTADYVVQVLQGTIPFWLVPTLTFILAGMISFSTGTSWGAMAILMPLVVPLMWSMSMAAGFSPMQAQQELFIGVSAVLAGAVWGDHCSPISDTTIMSSMASACDHIDHVRTQMPYAIVVGMVSIIFGYIPVAFGMSPWISLCICLAALFGIMFVVGKKDEQQT